MSAMALSENCTNLKKHDLSLDSGVEKFLHILSEREIPFAIVTSSDEVKMSYLFKAHPELREMVSALVTAGLVTNSKPDPKAI